MGEDVAHLIDAVVGVDRHHDGTQVRERKKGEDGTRVVGRDHADAVAQTDAARRQRVRGRVRLAQHLGVGERAALEDDQLFVGMHPHAAFQQRHRRVVVRSETRYHLKRRERSGVGFDGE